MKESGMRSWANGPGKTCLRLKTVSERGFGSFLLNSLAESRCKSGRFMEDIFESLN
jgi:hypothetical protein